jgi:hypothetical protein
MTVDLESRVGYVAPSDGRSTLELVWSCLVTIGLCTWTLQRPNIVPFTKQRGSGARAQATILDDTDCILPGVCHIRRH